jgi:hypothetical protein
MSARHASAYRTHRNGLNACASEPRPHSDVDSPSIYGHLHIQLKHAVALTGVSTSRRANQVSIEGAAWFSMRT